MLRKRNAPAREGEGVVCLLGGDTDANTTTRARVQYLSRWGLSGYRASIVAPLAFGDAA